MSQIRSIILDLGGTLWYQPPDSVLLSEEQLHLKQADRMDAVLSRYRVTDVEGLYIQRELWAEYERLVSHTWALEPDGPSIIQGILEKSGISDSRALSVELWEHSYLGHSYFDTRLFPDTIPFLQWARAMGLKLGVISQRPFGGHFLRQDIKALHLDRYIDVALATADVGLRKPHPEPFLQTAAALSVAPSQCLVIGDMIETDVAGAKKANMVGVWLNRQGRSSTEWDNHYPRPEAPPDHEIKSLLEVHDLPELQSLTAKV